MFNKTLHYKSAVMMIKEAKKRPLMPLGAFIPANHPRLSKEECEHLCEETGWDMDELLKHFLWEG